MVTEFGITIFVRFEQLLNAYAQIVVKLFGRETELSFLQPSKADSPIDVTPLEMTTFVILP